MSRETKSVFCEMLNELVGCNRHKEWPQQQNADMLKSQRLSSLSLLLKEMISLVLYRSPAVLRCHAATAHSFNVVRKADPSFTRGRGHDALVTDLLPFVGLLKFSVGNSGVMSAL